MNKKKLLIVDKSFAIGGIQTSLMNMLDSLNDYYDIDLLMYYAEGPLKERLPAGIKLVRTSWRLETCGMSFRQCLHDGSFKQKIFRIMSTIWTKLFDNRIPLHFAIKHQDYLGRYDVAIAYHHEAGKNTLTSGFIRVIDTCCDAKIKLSWIHNDSESNDISENFNDKYYKKADRIVAVSEAVKNGFIKKHPLLADKTIAFHNFLNYERIDTYSKEACDDRYFSHSFVCFSACRLEPIKGIPRAITAMAEVLRKNDKIHTNIGYPLVVKPSKGGSSLGIHVCNNKKEFVKHVKEAFLYDNKVIIEKYVKAREFECAILDCGKRIISKVGEIVSINTIYDYEAKYVKDSKLLIPANISKNLERKIRNYSDMIFNILGLSDLARVDFLYDYNNDILYFNEVNTLPGFTAISMYPKLIENMGISYKNLITKLLMN